MAKDGEARSQSRRPRGRAEAHAHDREPPHEHEHAPRGAGSRARGFGNLQMDGFVDMLGAAARNGSDPSPIVDAIAQALVMVLGSGPAVATFESMLAVNQANGVMYHNAVANQQKTNILGMCATMKCVAALLDKPMDEVLVEEEEL